MPPHATCHASPDQHTPGGATGVTIPTTLPLPLDLDADEDKDEDKDEHAASSSSRKRSLRGGGRDRN